MDLAGLLNPSEGTEVGPVMTERKEGNEGLFHLSQVPGSRWLPGLNLSTELQSTIVNLISQTTTPGC